MFTLGYQIGLKPEEILDLEYWQFNTCMQGYELRLRDQLITGIQTGYWAGYYSQSKRPKEPSTIISKLLRPAEGLNERPDVDVEEYQRRDALFKKRLAEVVISGR